MPELTIPGGTHCYLFLTTVEHPNAAAVLAEMQQHAVPEKELSIEVCRDSDALEARLREHNLMRTVILFDAEVHGHFKYYNLTHGLSSIHKAPAWFTRQRFYWAVGVGARTLATNDTLRSCALAVLSSFVKKRAKKGYVPWGALAGEKQIITHCPPLLVGGIGGLERMYA